MPCVFAENLTEAQKRAYILADNQLALNAGWDEEMLSVELSDLQDQSFDLSLLGFDAGELDKLLGTGNEKDIADDDFDLTAALEKASSWSPATSGQSAGIVLCVAMPPRRKMWKSSWTARKQTSS